MDKDKIMEQLVAKFLDGATSNEEERRLYDYFTGSRVASHLHKYKAMFEWYAGGMAAPLPPVAEPEGRRARTVPMWARLPPGPPALSGLFERAQEITPRSCLSVLLKPLLANSPLME